MFYPVYIKATGVSKENLNQINTALESQMMFSLASEEKQDCITLDTVEVEE